MTIERFDNGPRMSRVVVHNDTVYLAGLTAEAAVGQSVAEQTTQELLVLRLALALGLEFVLVITF